MLPIPFAWNSGAGDRGRKRKECPRDAHRLGCASGLLCRTHYSLQQALLVKSLHMIPVVHLQHAAK